MGAPKADGLALIAVKEGFREVTGRYVVGESRSGRENLLPVWRGLVGRVGLEPTTRWLRAPVRNQKIQQHPVVGVAEHGKT